MALTSHPDAASLYAPAPAASPAPWNIDDEGVIRAADGHVVGVVGSPFEAMTEQDRANAAAILAAFARTPTPATEEA